MKKLVMALLCLIGATSNVSSEKPLYRTLDFETQPDLTCRYTNGVCNPTTYP